MTFHIRSAAAAATCLPLVACGQGADQAAMESQAAAEPLVLQKSMEEVITIESQNVLNVLIAALNDQAEVDPAKLTDEDWAAMEAAAARLRDEFKALRDRQIQVVAAPGDMIDGEENPGALKAADVQARIDENPTDFQSHAGVLLVETERMVTASRAHDAATMWEVGLDLDPMCTECHEQYWYPEPPEDEDDH